MTMTVPIGVMTLSSRCEISRSGILSLSDEEERDRMVPGIDRFPVNKFKLE